MNKSLHSALLKIYTTEDDLLLPPLKRTTQCLTVLASTVWAPETFTSINECQRVLFFPQGEIQHHTFALYTLPSQTPFCQTAPLLPSLTQQPDVTECWWEGSTSSAIPPTFFSDMEGQHNKIGDITFEAALVVPVLHFLGNNLCFILN